ncbi:hypothetical protein H2200_005607 [Cladophialophora chaetospira]|uniref:Uncharacterized protein n=1 Tax=Cladophialophora chaetospira TaxID=386627 RepID=A0AA39CJS6_9EURO|nr:hypothetical protein H2200_005607 [Cladophialophora chaetospira]
MSQQSVVSTQISSSIIKLVLNRPRSLNAINAALLEELVNKLKQIAEDPEVRIIILEGEGPRSFCAGEDLKETLAPETGSFDELQSAFHKLQDITRYTSNSDKLVITTVQGYAVGGGAEIALAADFVIGGPNAKFKFPEYSSKRMKLFGLLTELVEDPKQRALKLALELEKLPAKAARHSKTSLETATFPSMEDVLSDEVRVANICFAQDDAAQAFQNFRERKMPQVNGIKSQRATNGESTLPSTGLKEGDLPKDLNSALKAALEHFPDRIFIRFAGRDTSFREFE